MTSRRTLWVALILSLLAGPLALAGAPARAAQADPDPATGSAQEVAEQALETVQDLVEPATTGTTTAADADGKDLTLALRDLAVTRNALPRAKKDAAARLLARPTDPSSVCNDPDTGDLVCYDGPEQTYCTTGFCIHYVTTGRHAVSTEDDGAGGRWKGDGSAADGVPDYVQQVERTVRSIAGKYVAAGYRPPVSDGTKGGGTDNFDIYLGELGELGYYGYCVPESSSSAHVAAAGYCVLDDDYAEYGSRSTPAENLGVTVAHEFFHAVQFAYDINESSWFMESTATWVEDELYDAVNDNRQYLPFGPLGKPGQPLGTNSNFNVYGAWIFIRYLTETFPARQGALPKIVADLWLKAAGGTTSGQALTSILAARGTTYGAQLARFAVWNRRPGAFYSEGSAYKAAPLYKSWTLGTSAPSQSVRFTANRSAARHVRFTRGGSLKGSWKLKVSLDLNTTASGALAYVTIKPVGKAARSSRIKLNSAGDAKPTYWFGPKTSWVEVSLVNAGSANRTQAVSAKATR